MSLARSIVNDCLQITDKDNVAINLYPHNLDLAEETAVECFKKGADVIMSLYTDRYYTSQFRHLSVASLREPSAFCRSLTETSTAEIFMAGTYDPTVLRGIDPRKLAADSEGETNAHFPLSEERRIRTLNIGLALVTKPRAKVYGFNYEKWSKMMKAASSVDYAKLAKTGRALKDLLRDADEISITGPGHTNVTLQVSGRKWYLSDGVVDEEDVRNKDLNDGIPAGSIAVAPLEDSAQGEVTFNAGTPNMGLQVVGLGMSFKKGRVTKFKWSESATKVKANWEQGTGDKSTIAYFGIGFNPKAEAGYTANNVAYGAVTLGIGGNEGLGGKNRPGFNFLDTITGATVKADGKTILQKGRIVKV